MRSYTMHIMRDGMFETHYYEVESPSRIRQLAIELFREEFRREPSFHWHKDGLMAEAWDDHDGHRCNLIQLDQTNHWCGFLGPLPIIARPCMALERRAA